MQRCILYIVVQRSTELVHSTDLQTVQDDDTIDRL